MLWTFAMAEHTSAPPSAERPTELYRPLSGLALASFFLAAPYSALVALLGLIAWFTGSPLFLGTWTLLFPLTTALLAWIALRQIQASEGTRSGAALARWALKLSIVFGFVYGAIHLATYLAVSMQADDFASKWLGKLRKGEINAAFLDTQDPEQRKDDNPANSKRMAIRYDRGMPGRPGPLSMFRSNELIRVLEQGGTEAAIEALGVKDWDYDQRGYRVRPKFRVTTAEGVFEVVVTVRSSDTKEARRWRVVWSEAESGIDGSPLLTPLGQIMQGWRGDSRRFAAEWLQRRAQGQAESVYLDTCDFPAREAMLRAFNAQVIVANLAATGSALALQTPGILFAHVGLLANPEWRAASYLPGYREFVAGNLVSNDELEAPDKLKEEVRTESKQFFRPSSLLQARLTETNARSLPVDPSAGPFRIVHDLEIEATAGTAGRGTRYRGDARLTLESEPGPITDRQPRWRVRGLSIVRASDAAQPPPGGQ